MLEFTLDMLFRTGVTLTLASIFIIFAWLASQTILKVYTGINFSKSLHNKSANGKDLINNEIAVKVITNVLLSISIIVALCILGVFFMAGGVG